MAYKKTIVRKGGKYVMDEINYKILDELIDNARVTKAEIGKRLSLARIAVVARIDEMENAGIIEGYTVMINWDKLDNGGN